MVQKRKNYRKWIWWGVGILAVVLIVVGVVIGVNNSGSHEEDKDMEISQSENSGDEKVEESTTTEADVEFGEAQTPVQYTGENPNEMNELTGVVTYASVNDGVLVIRVSIDQYLVSGNCELTLSRGGATIYNSIADIVGDASTGMCKGFDVPVGELGGGETDIIVNLNADGKSGVIRGEVSI